MLGCKDETLPLLLLRVLMALDRGYPGAFPRANSGSIRVPGSFTPCNTRNGVTSKWNDHKSIPRGPWVSTINQQSRRYATFSFEAFFIAPGEQLGSFLLQLTPRAHG